MSIKLQKSAFVLPFVKTRWPNQVKMIYLRIQRPDEVVLSSSDAGMFEYQKQSVVYTAKRELEYDNLDIDMCIYWDKSEELMAGTYKITLYAEGYEIGTGSIELK